MTIKDKVHVTIGISRKNKDRYNQHEVIQKLARTLGASNSAAHIAKGISQNTYGHGSDFRVLLKLSYEQLGRYVAMRAETNEKDFWLWPEVIEVERPAPPIETILDISGAL
tara:strand:+ start:24208 stop:24540 length:333 start_codon:yes stop_codon:yes gene_type:complete